MTGADLELNRSVELEITINGKKVTLLSKIKMVIDQTILLAPIRSEGKLVGFPPTCTVNLIYPDTANTYVWYGVDVRVVKYDQKPYHAITIENEASIINRRATFRVYSGEEMLITTFTHEGPQPLRVVVRDISEHGMSFFSQHKLDIGRTVRLNLMIQNDRELHLGAQIVREKNEGSRFGTLYGCKFIEKHPLLSNYLMRLQQDRQKKRMGLK